MITLTSKAHITGCSKSQLNLIKRRLSIQNPQFIQARRLQLPGHYQRTLRYYTLDGQDITIPIGSLPELSGYLRGQSYDDQRITGKSIDITSKIQLEDYQKTAVDHLEKKTVGVICSPTGSGKTIMMIDLICRRKQPTLILVNTLALMEQFKERLLTFTSLKDSEIGIVGGGKVKLRPITIATLQTLTRRIGTKIFDEINKTFGQILCDEVHIIAAQTFYKVLNELTAKYKHGFSATLTRADGLIDVVHFAVGPTVYSVPKEAVAKRVKQPTVEYVETNYDYPLFDISEYAFMLNDLALNEERNQLILDLVKQHTGYKKVLLCSRTSQANYLHKAIKGSVLILGNSKKKEQAAAFKAIQTTADTLISTYKFFQLGIDIPCLNLLIACSPIKDETALRQCAGRLARIDPSSKSPKMIVLLDKQIGVLKRQSYAIKRILNHL